MKLPDILRMMMAAAVLFVLPFAAHAATPVSKDEANAFYAQCMAKPDERLSPDTQNEFCACASAHMMQTMSAEDMKLAAESTPAGRVMAKKMMITVYGPCIGGPITEVAGGRCESDPRVVLADKMVRRDVVCACMADKITTWLDVSGPDTLAKVMEATPFVNDTLDTVMESGVYKKEEYEIMMDCLHDRDSIRRKK
jgi:hypothetical protein